MRYDYFVVFPNGVKYVDNILTILRKYPDLELLYFRYHEPYDFVDFVDSLYAKDPVPKQHIKNKTKYLVDIGKETYVGLIRNRKPEEKLVGERPYRHIQCMLMNRFKWEAREKFNPIINGERSENHIIHTSDFEEQMIDFWKTLNLHTIEQITNPPNKLLPFLPFHVPAFKKFKLKEINIRKLQCAQMTDEKNKRFPIEKSIYYRFTQGEEQPFIDYWEKFRGTRIWEDKSPQKFRELIENYEPDERYPVVLNNIVIDGNHRLSTLLSRGIHKTKVICI